MNGESARQRPIRRAYFLRLSVVGLLVASVLGFANLGHRAIAAAPTDELTISDASATEGDAVEFVITLPAGVTGPVTGTFATEGGSGTTPATEGDDCAVPDDYDDVATPDTGDDATEEETGAFTIDVDETSTTVEVPTCPDSFAEPNENFGVRITSVVGAAPCLDDDENCRATGTILNNDAPPAELSIADVTFAEGGAQVFTLTLDKAAGQDVTVNYHTEDGSAESGSDYTEVDDGTVTFTDPQTTATASVTITPDNVAEADETFTLEVDSATNVKVSGLNLTAVGTIDDDDTVPEITITGDETTEGEAGTTGTCTDDSDPAPDPDTEAQCVVFQVSLSGTAGSNVTLDFATADQDAEAPQDYVARSGQLSFPAGSDEEDVKLVTVRVNGDATTEGNEAFLLVVDNLENVSCPGETETCSAVGLIAEGAIPISVQDKSVTEGTTTTNVSVDISLESPPAESIDVGYHTSDGTAEAGEDYAPAGADAEVTFAANDQTETVQITVNPDGFDEDNETFFVTAEEPATVEDPEPGTTATCTSDDACTGVVTIADEAGDTPPSLSINNPAAVSEGNSGTKTITFTVSLSAASGRTVTVGHATANGPTGNTGAVGRAECTGTTDFRSTSGTLTFAAGQTSRTTSVEVCGDEFAEADPETFFVNLSGAANATIADPQGVGTIDNDDGDAPALSISDRTRSEGDGGKTAFNFTITLAAQSGKDVSVTYNTDAGTPTSATSSVSGSTTCDAGIDYIGALATVTIPAGATTRTITVDVCGDTWNEADEERFVVKLSNPVNATLGDAEGVGQINDDDPTPFLSIDGSTVAEDQGPASFRVALSTASGRTVTVNHATANSSATSPADFTATSGTLTFAPGETVKTVTVPLVADQVKEADETFTVTLSGPSNATLADSSATGRILNDDDPQGYSLLGSDGGVFSFGNARNRGSIPGLGLKLNQPPIGMAYTPSGNGYWIVAQDGGIFTFGDAGFFGSTGDTKLNAPVLGMEPTPSGNGYWLFAADGGIFSFGDAQFFGSTGDIKLNAPAVGMAATSTGKGYWLVAQDGGIFTFGDAKFFGSTGDIKLNQPVFDMAPTPGNSGYWLVARDGGIFSFGSAQTKFFGSAANANPATVIGIGATPSGNGYWIADQRGVVYAFGDARAIGDVRGRGRTVVGFAAAPQPTS